MWRRRYVKNYVKGNQMNNSIIKERNKETERRLGGTMNK
jgi:hypothetical protein